ncbi:MAG: Hsp70 family protein, partial [Planctomycetia bacterium]
ERNTTIPTEKKQVFSTAEDGQTAVDIKVLQGEREFANDNRLLGTFRLDGIPAAGRGAPQIEVSFAIDANGILNVGAKDLGTGKEKSVKVESSSGLSQADVEQMRRDAESHASDDKKRRELIDARNGADAACYDADKQLKEMGDKISASDREPIDKAVERVKGVAKGDDLAAIQQAVDGLRQAVMAMGQAFYQRSAGAAGGAPEAEEAAAGKPDDTIDVEFKEKS